VLLLVGALVACGSSGGGSATTPSDIGKPLDKAAANQAVLDRLGPMKPATGNTTRGVVNGKVIKIGGVADV
jgi:hypothetical protein